MMLLVRREYEGAVDPYPAVRAVAEQVDDRRALRGFDE